MARESSIYRQVRCMCIDEEPEVGETQGGGAVSGADDHSSPGSDSS